MGKSLGEYHTARLKSCLKCGALYFEKEEKCPKCGALNTDLIQHRARTQAEEVDSLARAYSTTTSAIELTSGAVNALEGTIDLLGTIPPEYQESLGIAELSPEATEMKAQIENVTRRLESLEERIGRVKEKRFEDAKREKELFMPARVLEGLPNDVNKIIDSIRKCFKRNIPEFCPTFIRKALIAAIVIRFKMDNKQDMLYHDGNPYGLPKMLELARQERYISQYMLQQLRREVKVFGDIGAHDYKIDFEQEDVIPLFKLLRLALEQIYHEE